MSNAYYVFKKNKLLSNFNILKNIFIKKFANFQICYSFKTNSYEPLLFLLKNNGLYAEVVSPYEFENAIKIGFDISNIVYNGVCKNYATIEKCLDGNGYLNIDNQEDLESVLRYGENTKKTPSVGLRLAFDNGGPFVSRFGISIDSPLLEKIYNLEKNGKIIIKGLHCHFTSNRKPENYKLYGKVLGFYSCFFNNIEYLDFGGNFPSPSEVKNYEIFAQCMKDGLSDGFLFYEKYNDDFSRSSEYIMNESRKLNVFSDSEKCKFEDKISKLKIMIEPGTALVKDAFDIRSHVLHIKDGFIITDISLFDLGESAISDQCRIKIINRNDLSETPYIENHKITGYTCMENDVLKKSFSGKISVGDEILFSSCGSYSLCFSNNFINPPLSIKES